jgi:hypothetical protein
MRLICDCGNEININDGDDGFKFGIQIHSNPRENKDDGLYAIKTKFRCRNCKKEIRIDTY